MGHVEGRLQTLDEFLRRRDWPHNAFVKEPGFAALYVRRSDRWLDGRRMCNVLDIASVQARTPGKGVFGRLVAQLLSEGTVLYVENVHNKRLAAWLSRHGFSQVLDNSYYKFPPKDATQGRLVSYEKKPPL